MNFSHEEPYLRSLKIRQLSTVATLVVLLYEYVIMAKGEYHYIWRRPFKKNQGIYLFSRYFGIIVQSVNTYLVFGPHSHISIGEGACKKWQLLQVLSAYALTGALHLVLMMMVYALHLKDLKIGVYLTMLYLTQIALQAFVTPKAVWFVAYNGICDTTQVPHDVIYLGISTGVTYASLALLTALKRDLLALRTPVVKRLIRDGAGTIFLLCSIFTTIVSYSVVRQDAKGHMVYGWPNAIVSILCCRIIMNMETLEYEEPDCDLAMGFNSFDNLQLIRLERERREREGLPMNSTQSV